MDQTNYLASIQFDYTYPNIYNIKLFIFRHNRVELLTELIFNYPIHSKLRKLAKKISFRYSNYFVILEIELWLNQVKKNSLQSSISPHHVDHVRAPIVETISGKWNSITRAETNVPSWLTFSLIVSLNHRVTRLFNRSKEWLHTRASVFWKDAWCQQYRSRDYAKNLNPPTRLWWWSTVY